MVERYDSRHLRVETGYRLPGLIAGWSYAATGRDQIELDIESVIEPFHVHCAAATMPPCGKTQLQAAVVFMISERDCRLTHTLDLSQIECLPSFHKCTFKAKSAGDQIMKSMDVATIWGFVELLNEDRDQLATDIAALEDFNKRSVQ